MSDIIDLLGTLLADTQVLAIKTQHYHWNVLGRNFFSLHQAFEDQYNEMNTEIDLIAERIRALGSPVMGDMNTYLKQTSLESRPVSGDDRSIVEDLITGHNGIIETLKSLISATDAAGDKATEDMAIKLCFDHEKVLWMLQSFVA